MSSRNERPWIEHRSEQDFPKKQATACAGGILAVLAVVAHAQTPQPPMMGAPPPPQLRVAGEAVARASPDEARLEVGVVTEARTAEEASAENAKRQQQVIQALRKVLGAQAQVSSVAYTVNPTYRYPQPNEGGPPTISGYTATNTVRALISRLENVGPAIDAATRAGANQIGRLEFGIADENPVRERALREAAQLAQSKARSLAEALGVRVLRVLRAEEEWTPGSPRPPMPMMAERSMAAATPIEAGPIELRALVWLTVEIAPKQ